jgi:hypothetical protein
MRTFWDGNLHRCTSVDVLPLYGMQEVWGSNPHSSTRNSSSECRSEAIWMGFKID